MELVLPESNVPTGVIVTAEYVKPITPVKLVWGKEISLKLDNEVTLTSATIVIQHLARSAASLNLYGSTILEQTKVDYWLSFATSLQPDDAAKMDQLERLLNIKLTYLVGQTFMAADLAVWGSLFGKAVDEKFVNVKRWYKFIESQSKIKEAIKNLPEKMKASRSSLSNQADGGLKEEGKVIHFPPEDSSKDQVTPAAPPSSASGPAQENKAKEWKADGVASVPIAVAVKPKKQQAMKETAEAAIAGRK